MTPLTLTWLLWTTLAIGVGAVVAVRRGPHLGVGAAAAIGLLAPNWAFLLYGPLQLDAKLTGVAVLLIAYCLHPRGKLRFPITSLDVLIVAIVAVQLTSDAVNGELSPAAVLRAAGEWMAPYLAGRCLGLYRGGVTAVAPWFAVATIVLAAAAVFESMTDRNLWETLFLPIDDLVDRLRAQRYGIGFRAVGPTRHPIFLATVFLLMTPWAVATAERGRTASVRLVGVVASVAILLGMLATFSRGPLLAAGVGAIAFALIRWPRLRLPTLLTMAVLAVGIGVAWNRPELWDRAADWVSRTDSVRGKGELVVVDGEAKTYTPTGNRILVWQIYAPLVARGGPLGYGTTRVSSFPPDVPLPAVARSAEVLGIVDNTYLLFGLRFGWIGLILLIGFMVMAIVTALRLRHAAGIVAYPHGPLFFGVIACTLLAASLQMLLVFGTYEFMFWVIFTVGSVSGNRSLHREILGGTAPNVDEFGSG